MPDREVIVFVGDGSYLMMNSDLYSSVLSGHKLIVVVCDNGGFAVINRLQVNQGGEPFNNLLRDAQGRARSSTSTSPAHAAAMGCHAETVHSIAELEAAFGRARAADRTYVIAHQDVTRTTWTEGGVFWEVGVPEVSDRAEVRGPRATMDEGKRHSGSDGERDDGGARCRRQGHRRHRRHARASARRRPAWLARARRRRHRHRRPEIASEAKQ